VSRRNRGLVLIAVFKWINALLLAAVALGLLKLLHQDVGEVAENFIRSIRVDPDNKFLSSILAKLSGIDDPKLQALSGVSFGYCALFMVEGTGLYFEKRWAEFLTIIATASLLPVEVYELVQKVDALKISVLIFNILILLFLVVIVLRNADSAKRKR
jgi:uncharacterized membrane protein (DUF2068 family)